MGKIPVGATLALACRFVMKDFLRILGIMILPMAIMWIPGLLMRPQMMTLSAQMTVQDYSGLRQLWAILLPLYLVGFVLLFMQMIGIARLALGLHRGWFYFSLGRPVWRLIGSFLLLILLMILGWLAAILGGVVLGFVLGFLSRLVNNSVFTIVVAAVTAIALLGLWCGYVYCLVRLTFLLCPVIAADEKGFALAQSWRLGKGNFWRMFAIILVILVPVMILEGILLFAYLFKGVSFPTTPASADQAAAFQAALNARATEVMTAMFHYWYISFPLGIVFMVVFYGLIVGTQSFAYRAVTAGPVTEFD